MSNHMMRAMVLHGPLDIRVESRPVPQPGRGEVLLRITTSGICGSDANAYTKGPGANDGSKVDHPLVLGHEFAGVVVDVGPEVEELSLGTLVSSGAGISCGACGPCRDGRTNLCLSYTTAGVHRDGGLAEFSSVMAGTCEPAEKHGVSGDDAGLAQPMAIAHHTVRRGRLAPGERALILGVGGIGMFATWAASRLDAEVTAVDLSADRVEIARRLGAAKAYTLRGGEMPQDLLAGEPFDVIYEITGTAKALTDALRIARRGTRVVVTGIQHQAQHLDARRTALEEIEIIGSAAHVRGVDLPSALDLLAERDEGWSDCAPNVLPLDRALPDGIIPLAERRATQIKTLIDPSAASVRAYRR